MSVIETIKNIVGDKGLLLGSDVTNRPNAPMGQGECPALAIVRPASTEEVSLVLKACYDAGQSIVPMGGLTGLVSGTSCSPSDIGLSLERMNAIESVDAEAGIMVVEAGAILQNVQERAIDEGWQFPVDFGARGSSMIGGNIATNAGGNSVVRYGMMRDQVLGLEAVLSDGTVISSMNEMIKNNTGYDLKQLFIGSEGTLGIVTRAVLRLRAPTPAVQTAFVGLNSFADTTLLLRRLGIQLEGKLSAFEVMWKDHYCMMTEKGGHQSFLPQIYPYYVLLESSGASLEREEQHFMEVLGALMEEGLIPDAVISQSQAQAQQLWEMRDDIEFIFQELSPLAAFDISLPIREMESYISKVENALTAVSSEMRTGVFGHLGDGNLHIVVGPINDKQEVERIVYHTLEEFGGSISAEHCIGLDKRPYLSCSRNPAELALMKTLKQALDPKNILNPGKVL